MRIRSIHGLIAALLVLAAAIHPLTHALQAHADPLRLTLPARNHASPLKERAPLPGRDISLGNRVSF